MLCKINNEKASPVKPLEQEESLKNNFMIQYSNFSRTMKPKSHKSEANLTNKLKNMCVIFVFLFIVNQIYGQNEQSKSGQQTYFGLGIGLDYGGVFGGKLEYLPVKNFGIYGGLGYNLLSAGWNIGITAKMAPDKYVSFNPMLFYGYNGVSKCDGASQYDMTSYGITIGANLDIKLGHTGNKISVGLFAPIRSQKFKDNYDAMKNNPYVEIKNELWPVAISVGFNFKLNK